MPRTYRGEIRIDAEPSRVFEHFTNAEALARWMGDTAVVDPRPGGEFTLDINGGPVVGRYVEVEFPRRVVITWGRQGSAGFPPGSSVLSVTLIPDGDGTVVRVVHSGLPSTESDQHRVGWQHYLPRLATAAVGGDPGVDPWSLALPAEAIPRSDGDCIARGAATT
jgi:uncharacterized protein YndB with AHSA1/START domain